MRILFLVTLVTLLAGCPPRGGGVTFTATTPRAVYGAGEPVELALALTNRGGPTVALAPRWEGLVEVAALERDGQPVAPTSGEIAYEVALADQLAWSRAPLASGATARFAWASVDGALRTVAPAPGATPIARSYPLAAPGHYRLVLRYRDGATAAAAAPIAFEIR